MRPVWTLGHSSRSSAALVQLLLDAGIEAVVDVRRFPGSRAHPHFNVPALAAALHTGGIEYRSMPELGGHRPARPDSSNTIWHNEAFRGYADYMESEKFAEALDDLVDFSRERNTVLLCSEALWRRCHRAMIADALKARGIPVLHLMSEGKVVEHPYTSAATIVEGRVVYGPERRG